jgi:hypothetical protein
MQKEIKSFEDFHAGHSLHEIMQEEGHDMAWLAQHTGRDIMFLQALLEQPDMDAELFVRIGKPLEPLFLQRMHEVIFGEQTDAVK